MIEKNNELKHVGVMGMRWGRNRGNSRLKETRRFRDRKTGDMVVRYDAKSAFRDLFTKAGKNAALTAVLSMGISTAMGKGFYEAAPHATKAALLSVGLTTIKKVIETTELN